MEHARRLRRPDGVTIAWRTTPAAARGHGGTPRGAVVLIHGLASNLTRWSEFVEHTSLVRDWDVIRVDLRGHERSPTRGPIGIETWCDDLAALLAREGHARAVIVGHSLGAQVALHFAARHAVATQGLVLIDPVFRDALRGRWKWLARAAPLLRAAATLVRGLNALGLGRRCLPALDLRVLDEQARRALQSDADTRRFVRRYSSMRADLRTFHTAPYLQEQAEMFRPVPPPEAVTAPVLLLLSAGATFADTGTTRANAARLPAVEVQAIDCEHWPLTERPAEVREAIERWCGRLP
jgi:pimeloyl-ACP methyl ester carboxylesterase